MLRALLLRGFVVLIPVTLFVASPFFAAWQLREAIKTGDTELLERKIEWDSVRASLKSSLAAHAQLLPEVTAAGEQVKPTLWQRVKSALGSTMLDRFVETYATPEGLPKLFQYRKTWKEQVVRETAENADAPWHQRFARFYARLKRAEFQTPTRIEFEIADRLANRNYISVFELKSFEWKLTSLRVVAADPTPNVASP